MKEIAAFIHCRRCVVGRQTQRLEVGFTGDALRVQCRKHGLVGDFTPASLAARLEHPPECECCRLQRGEPS